MFRNIQRLYASPRAVFAACWMVLFLLYLPAANAGWVSDTLGWLDAVRHQPFLYYINRSGWATHTFYQTTQTATWLLYQCLGANKWAWHLVHISLHALASALLFTMIRCVLRDSGMRLENAAGWMAVLLFCSAPALSEVIVWEGCFHYLEGLLFQLLVLWMMLRSLHGSRPLEALLAILVMLLAAGALELFYLTPLLMGLLLFYYRDVLRWDRGRIARAVRFFLLPQVFIVGLHLLSARLLLGTATARLGNSPLEQPLSAFAIKPPMLLFHLLGGRFLPQAVRDAVFRTFCSHLGAGIFYGMAGAIVLFLLLRFRSLKPAAALPALAFLWMLLAMMFVSPMWLPLRLLITGDRYLYVILPPFFWLISLLVLRIRKRPVIVFLAGLIITLQCAGAWRLNRLWQASDKITQSLAKSFAVPDSTKITLLLNNPQSLCGAPMIGAGRASELKLLHNLFYAPPISGEVYDVFAGELEDTGDMISIQPPEAGEIRIEYPDEALPLKMQHTGPRWWFGSDYATARHTPLFEAVVDSTSPSAYTLFLKEDRRRFVLMYVQGNKWEVAYTAH